MTLPSFLYKPRNLFFFFFIIYTLISFIPKPVGMTTTNGDEPHYLVMTYNLIHKGNLEDMEEVYDPVKKIYKEWYGADEITGHLMALPSMPGELYAYHQIGLPILLMPGFYLGGLTGSIITLTFLMALGVTFMYKTIQYYFDETISLGTTLLVGLSLPVGVFANLIYPETVVFLFTTTCMMIMLHKNFRLTLPIILFLAFILVYLPIFHLKFLTLSILLLIYIIAVKFKKELPQLITLTIISIIGFSAYMYWLNSYYDWKLGEALGGISAGTKLSILEIPSGLLGILVDRENGILIYSPFYIYVIYSILPVLRKTFSESYYKAMHTIFPLFFSAAFTAFFTMFPYVMGGANPSGRYNLPVMAAMAILLAIGFKTQMRIKVQKTIIKILVVYSLLIFALISYNPLLALPGNMENKVFFFLLRGNAHVMINVYLPNLSKYAREIPLIDYIKGIGVFGGLISLTGWGTFTNVKKDLNEVKEDFLDFFSKNHKLWAFSSRRNSVKKSK